MLKPISVNNFNEYTNDILIYMAIGTGTAIYFDYLKTATKSWCVPWMKWCLVGC